MKFMFPMVTDTPRDEQSEHGLYGFRTLLLFPMRVAISDRIEQTRLQIDQPGFTA